MSPECFHGARNGFVNGQVFRSMLEGWFQSTNGAQLACARSSPFSNAYGKWLRVCPGFRPCAIRRNTPIARSATRSPTQVMRRGGGMTTGRGGFATIKNDRRPYSIVDQRIFRLRLSVTARLVLAWVDGRPAGWRFRLEHMWREVNITRAQWLCAKRELKDAGFFAQTRRQRALGKGVIEWDNEFLLTDSLLEKNDSGHRDAASEKEYVDEEF